MSENAGESTHEPIDGLDTPGIVTAGFVAAIGTFTLIVALQAFYLFYTERGSRGERQRSPAHSSTSVIAEQRAQLRRYGWLDRERGVVAIPIERAMELTVQELRSQEDKMR